LRRETAAEHAAIEAASGIMHQGLTCDEYRRYLERWFGFLAPLESELHRQKVWGALGLDARERCKRQQLESDLAALGSTVCALPLAGAPELRGLSEAVGSAYVIEGSTLGGRVLSRHVQTCLGAEVPRAFLEVYGAHTGERWQIFRAALAAHARSRDVQDRVIAGAKLTFRAFTRWLERS
jgi:heme oxygenase (biliverdin-IX-beta and delta-forming)